MTGRLAIGAILVILQCYWFSYILFSLGTYSDEISRLLRILSIVVVIYIVNKEDNPSYKLAWVILLLAFPLLGGAFYIYIGNKRPSRRLHKILNKEEKDTRSLLPKNEQAAQRLRQLDEGAFCQSEYISNIAQYPLYDNSDVVYFSSGESCYEQVLKEIRKAKHFIFMEYFIIKEGLMLDEILEILKKKAKEGVDVRIMYDDVGCISEIPNDFHKQMEACGISCMRFNVFIPIVSTAWNNRDHRKILVVDGHTAFTGGFNIADEYVNWEERFGYWKDSGLMLRGQAAWSLTVMFLRAWNPLRKIEQKEVEKDYMKFYPKDKKVIGDGFIQPYSDTPLDSEIVGESIYLNIIGNATKYLYITTPYLIIDNELMTALCLAAKRGVDVRIITPGIPDKKSIFLVTQSYFYPLIKAGVRIYSYTPGFIHAKNVVCDGKVATIGTVNWDYRSLYLHFECGVFMAYTSAVNDIYEDYKETLKQSKEITLEDCTKPLFLRLLQSILRCFAPLL